MRASYRLSTLSLVLGFRGKMSMQGPTIQVIPPIRYPPAVAPTAPGLDDLSEFLDIGRHPALEGAGLYDLAL